MKKLLLCLLLFSGCAQDVFFDPRVEDYVYQFEEYMGVTITYDVLVEPMEDWYKDDVWGLCRKRPTNKTVIIDEVFYETQILNFPENRDRVFMPLVWHELGHCEFGLEHDNSRLEGGMPKSWMSNGQTENSKYMYWDTHREYYKQELKERAGL